jgi:hypothetical protein
MGQDQMNNDDLQALRDKLDAFSHRLNARVSEFKKRGEFSDTQQPIADGIRKRRKAIRAKLNAAIRKGAMWDSIKYEFERDFNALSEEFLQWEERLDADAMKRKTRNT